MIRRSFLFHYIRVMSVPIGTPLNKNLQPRYSSFRLPTLTLMVLTLGRPAY